MDGLDAAQLDDRSARAGWDPSGENERAAGSGWRHLVRRFVVLLGCVVPVAAVAAAIHLSKLEIPPVQAPPRAAQPATAASFVAPAEPATDPSRSPVDRVDPAWADGVAAVTGIPARALLAYASADLTVADEQAGCGLGWNTLAAIGAVESGHGTHAGAVLREDGHPDPAIRGIALDGTREGVAALADTDGGVWDGDVHWDRAVGPMQFIPSTWVRWGADGNGDGAADPDQIDDATLAAARYLCASGPMGDADGWRAAVHSYNHSDAYVDQIAAVANRYAAAVQGPS